MVLEAASIVRFAVVTFQINEPVFRPERRQERQNPLYARSTQDSEIVPPDQLLAIRMDESVGTPDASHMDAGHHGDFR